MFLRFFIPIIALILLQILLEMGGISKELRNDFEESYEVLRCARQDVFERNIRDAAIYIKKLNPKLEANPDAILPPDAEKCETSAYAVYRETNEDLELLYPNWSFLESIPGESEGER